MSNSEIFDKYAEIAIKEGLVKEAAEEKTNPRYDSQDLSEIEILYGVQPNGKDDDILDKAHPESPAVVAPSYDRSQAIVENLKEQQNMIADIALKPNDGKLTQHRYVKAQHELVNELVRIAFMLDMKGEEDLMKLADCCSERVIKDKKKDNLIKKTEDTETQPIEKVAWAWVWPLVRVIGIRILPKALMAAGIYSAVSNTVNISRGMMEDCSVFLSEVGDVTEDFPEFGLEISSFLGDVRKLRAQAKVVNQIRIGISKLAAKAKSKDESVGEEIKLFNQKYNNAIIQILESYKKSCEDMVAVIPEYIGMIERVPKTYESTSFWTLSKRWGSWLEPAKYIKEFISPGDVTEAVKALERVQSSCTSEFDAINDNIKRVNVLNAISKKLAGKIKEEQEKAQETGEEPNVEEVISDIEGLFELAPE